MTIKGLSDARRLTRLGKIRLGIKKVSEKSGKDYPAAVDYFVCPPEVEEVYGKEPRELLILFPIEDETRFARQFYSAYSATRGLVCRGDGEIANRLIEKGNKNMAIADKDSQITEMIELECPGKECQYYIEKRCKRLMNLQFLLPEVPGLGVWQLDTSSVNSILNINSGIDLIKAICGRVAMLPIFLAVKPQEVTAEGKRKTVYTLSLTMKTKLADLQRIALMAPGQTLLPPPEPDDEREELLYHENGNGEIEIIPEEIEPIIKVPQHKTEKLKVNVRVKAAKEIFNSREPENEEEIEKIENRKKIWAILQDKYKGAATKERGKIYEAYGAKSSSDLTPEQVKEILKSLELSLKDNLENEEGKDGKN